jgi:hypothetical protein
MRRRIKKYQLKLFDCAELYENNYEQFEEKFPEKEKLLIKQIISQGRVKEGINKNSSSKMNKIEDLDFFYFGTSSKAVNSHSNYLNYLSDHYIPDRNNPLLRTCQDELNSITKLVPNDFKSPMIIEKWLHIIEDDLLNLKQLTHLESIVDVLYKESTNPKNLSVAAKSSLRDNTTLKNPFEELFDKQETLTAPLDPQHAGEHLSQKQQGKAVFEPGKEVEETHKLEQIKSNIFKRLSHELNTDPQELQKGNENNIILNGRSWQSFTDLNMVYEGQVNKDNNLAKEKPSSIEKCKRESIPESDIMGKNLSQFGLIIPENVRNNCTKPQGGNEPESSSFSSLLNNNVRRTVRAPNVTKFSQSIIKSVSNN